MNENDGLKRLHTEEILNKEDQQLFDVTSGTSVTQLADREAIIQKQSFANTQPLGGFFKTMNVVAKSSSKIAEKGNKFGLKVTKTNSHKSVVNSASLNTKISKKFLDKYGASQGQANTGEKTNQIQSKGEKQVAFNRDIES